MILEHWSEETKAGVRKMSRKENDRLNAIIAMNILVCDMNDETAHSEWICLVPDCATEQDFMDFALNDEGTEENELFNDAVKTFKRLWEEYASEDKGLYIGGKAY